MVYIPTVMLLYRSIAVQVVFYRQGFLENTQEQIFESNYRACRVYSLILLIEAVASNGSLGYIVS